jgi:hypothetical protein
MKNFARQNRLQTVDSRCNNHLCASRMQRTEIRVLNFNVAARTVPNANKAVR